jgi:hypothetical protein
MLRKAPPEDAEHAPGKQILCLYDDEDSRDEGNDNNETHGGGINKSEESSCGGDIAGCRNRMGQYNGNDDSDDDNSDDD